MPISESKGPKNDPITLVTRTSPDLYAFIKTHAFRRDVTIQELVRDILRSWVRRATPLNDPVFSLPSIGYRLPDPPSEKYSGYIESLRFLPEGEVKVDGNEPPPRTRHEQWPVRGE